MIIQSKRVYYQEQFQPLQIEIKEGKIKGIYPYGLFKDVKDYDNAMILPGLIDIHNHGYGGCDSNRATVAWVKKWAKYLPTEGVTSFCPTTSSAPHKQVLEGMRNIAQTVKEGYEGSNILGIYSEGPFISFDYRGAQSWENYLIPTEEIIDQYLEASDNRLIYVMLAPEMLTDMSVIKYCVSKGIKVAIGHSGASFKQCEEAINAGAKSFTHTFNGMKGLHHRETGTVGAAMYFDDAYAELIGDGVHVSFEAAHILAKVKGKDKLITVTDSVDLKGLPMGENVINGETFIVDENVARLKDGTLDGSVNRLNVLLKREIRQAHIDVVTAINSVTCNPATLLGYSDRKGYIKENYDADIVVLDEAFEPIQTYIAGKEML